MTETLRTELLEYYTTITPALKSAYGDLLSDLADWQWFVTMTFRNRVGLWSAQQRWSRLWTEVQRVTGRLEWWRATEYQHWRGVPHYHALITGIPAQLTSECSRLLVKEMAHDTAGISRVLEYDRELGASYYMAKYTVKELGDIQITRGLTKPKYASKMGG